MLINLILLNCYKILKFTTKKRSFDLFDFHNAILVFIYMGIGEDIIISVFCFIDFDFDFYLLLFFKIYWF